jgi:hypothetical protein
VGANAPGTAGLAETSCQAGSPVTYLAAVASFDEKRKAVDVEDAVGLCGLDFKPLGGPTAGAVTDYDVDTSGLNNTVRQVTTVNQNLALADADTALIVADARAIMGVDTAGVIKCGNDYTIRVTAVNFLTNVLTIAEASTEAADIATCIPGATVERMWVLPLKTAPVDKADEYFHATADADSFGAPSGTRPAYVMVYDDATSTEVNGEIMKVVAITKADYTSDATDATNNS